MIDWDSTKAAAFISEPRVKKMIEECSSNQKSVFDLGCYTGDIAVELRKKNNRVFGFDCNKEFVNMTRNKGFFCSITDFEKGIPMEDTVSDVIIAGELIEHIYHTEIFLKECYRVLKNDGMLILSTPNLAYLGHRAKLLFGVAPPIMHYESGESIANPGHVRYFTKQTLTELLNKYGFKVEKVRGSHLFGNEMLGDLFPTLSYHLIVVARKI